MGPFWDVLWDVFLGRVFGTFFDEIACEYRAEAEGVRLAYAHNLAALGAFSIVFYCFLLFSIVFSAVFATVFGSALGLFLTRRRWSHRAAPLRPHLCAVFLRGVDRPPPLARDRGGARARERGWCDDAGPRGQFLYKK